MIPALFATLRSFKDAYLIKLMLLCAVLTAALLAGSVFGIDLALAHSHFFGNGLLGRLATKVIHWAGAGAATFAAWFLAPLLFPLISSLFLDGVVGRMETKYYNQPKSDGAPLMRSMTAALRFTGVSLLADLLLLPLMFLLPFIYVPLYYLLNGQLYGREYMELVALRYYPIKEARALRRKHFLKVYLAGLLIMLGFTVPFLNIIAPVVSAIFITHFYYGLPGRPETHALERQPDALSVN